MSEITVKLTLPALEEIMKLNGEIPVQLSYAAVKEISEKYSQAVIDNRVVKEALSLIEYQIGLAKEEVGKAITEKIGEWGNSIYNRGFKLRPDVKLALEREFEQIVFEMFRKWAKGPQFDAMLSQLIEGHFKKRIDDMIREIISKSIKDALVKS